ncbi:EspA/EspE family type VII secretion system effector [Mycobacterium sp. pR1184]|uniref:EspA/EspE family type VII secretion system effector n=1 Tax=Mycobacterium sp. pR1184 TaxID=3238981 RepID=UPI00351B7D79
MSWLRGAHDLAYVVGRGSPALGAGLQQDWVTTGANMGAAAGKFTWYLRDKFEILKTGLAKPGPTPTPTAIIDLAMVAVAALDMVNGFLAADQGGAFSTGKDRFENLRLTQELANPDPAKWDGDAAKSYAAVNDHLKNLADILQELDKQTQQCVADHAATIQQAHRVIALSLLALQVAQAAALLMWSWPVIGPAWSVAFQSVTVSAISLTITSYEFRVMNSSGETARKFDALAHEYKSIADRAAPTGTFATIEVLGADKTYTPDLPAISDALSDFSAPPSIARLAQISGQVVTPDEQNRRGARFSDTEALGQRASKATPTAVDRPAMTGQFADSSRQVPQQLNSVNQTMGSAQPLASVRQPAKPAGARDAGVAEAGSEGAERAPVDAVKNPEVKQVNRIR